MIDLTPLHNANRLLLEVPLRPVQGHRFQPTGFPDLGAATYRAGDNACLLVESAQSMANRLEATIWDEGSQAMIEPAKGMSYVRVVDGDGKYLTSSIEEAHRLNSAYIEKAEGGFHKQLDEEIGFDEKQPIDRPRFLKAVFKYDVNSLVHGVFLESIGGRLREPRAVSAFIEAERIEPVASGGVKNDRVMPGTESGGDRTAAEGFGNVPFHREEYTAPEITAYFNLDLAQIRGYGLGYEATNLLIVLAIYKVRRLLEGDLRLRTACEFEIATPGDGESDTLTGRLRGNIAKGDFALPSLADLETSLKEAIQQCSEQFAGEDGVTTVTYQLSRG